VQCLCSRRRCAAHSTACIAGGEKHTSIRYQRKQLGHEQRIRRLYYYFYSTIQ
jgi:hypothetical protein